MGGIVVGLGRVRVGDSMGGGRVSGRVRVG